MGCPFALENGVSTRSRPKAAGMTIIFWGIFKNRFQHAAARRRLDFDKVVFYVVDTVSTRSRPKAAGAPLALAGQAWAVSTRSRPKAAGQDVRPSISGHRLFQHAAARRRLGPSSLGRVLRNFCFNTQPPEGGWEDALESLFSNMVSTHSRLKAAVSRSCFLPTIKVFQHTAA